MDEPSIIAWSEPDPRALHRIALDALPPAHPNRRALCWPILASVALALVIVVGVLAFSGKAGAISTANGVLPASMNRPCPSEDAVNCYWNDGGAHPFVVRQFPGSSRMVCVMYQARRYAHRHDYCVGNEAAYVYLDRSDQPSRVFRDDLYRIHIASNGACIAALIGYDRWVELANPTQFPRRCHR